VIRRSRLERAEQLGAATVRLAAGQTQRQVAAELGVARSTLQDWRKPEAVGAAPAVLAAWMETPEGVRWLHQLVLAAHFSITLQGAAGIRVVCQFLELSGLSAFVGASYGTQQGSQCSAGGDAGRRRGGAARGAGAGHAASGSHGV
jgi:transcriptional regulator with XRE-family HTH domain